MKLTLNWLKEFVDLRDAPDKLAETLTMAGLEVESLAPLRTPEGQADWSIELGVTPNRGDCLSIVGIAREVPALGGGRLKIPALKPSKEKANPPPVKAQIASPRRCSRYSAAAGAGQQLRPSPPSVELRPEAAGIRAIH